MIALGFITLDHEDYKQIKGFFLIEDLTKENGPTVILNSKKSKEVLQKPKLQYKKIKQKESKTLSLKIF